MKRVLWWLIRLYLRPALSPWMPVAIQRFWSRAVGLILIGPRGYSTRRERIAGVDTTLIEPGTIERGRGLLYLHGGGYVVGGAGSHTKLAAWVAHAIGARAWLPEYRLAPEHPYPAALQDAVAVYAALIRDGQDPTRLVLAGDSAGAGLALATAVQIRDAGLPPPAALLLYSPWVDLSLSGSTVHSHVSRDAMLKPSWLRACADGYRGSARAQDPGCSPLFADLRGLPPMLIHVGSEEVLLDDANRLAQRAAEAGLVTAFRCFDGAGHVFQFNAGLLTDADASIRDSAHFIEALRPDWRKAA